MPRIEVAADTEHDYGVGIGTDQVQGEATACCIGEGDGMTDHMVELGGGDQSLGCTDDRSSGGRAG